MAKIENYLWLYEEVQVSQTKEGLRFESPWITVNYPRVVNNEMFQRCLDVLEKGPQSAEDIQLMDSLLRPVAQYPLFYCLPHHAKIEDGELKTYQAKYSQKSLRWDTQGFLNFSQPKVDLFDGVSVLTCMRQSHLKDVMQYLKTTTYKKNLPDLEGEILRKGTLMFVRQNHYVTERCEEALTPAMQLHSVAAEKVREFIKEESGHDRLLAQTFKELGVKPEATPVLESLVKVMDHFKKTAQENLLAFCFMVDMFERSAGANKNPMVQALLKMGEEKAAKPLQAHSNINVHGEHDNESFEIIAAVGLLPKSYVLDGVALAEQGSDLMLQFLDERNKTLSHISTLQ